MSRLHEVAAKDLAPCMVYVNVEGTPMLVLEASRGTTPNSSARTTYIVRSRSLRSVDEEHLHEVASRAKFMVLDGERAIAAAGDHLDDQIRRNLELLAALLESDTTHVEYELLVARDREQRKWLADRARECGQQLQAT